MDEAVFELNFGETESEWMESKEEHSSGNSLGLTAECFAKGLQMRKQIAERLSKLLKAALGFEAAVAGG